MGLTRFIINLAVKNQKIESFENYLFIGPHPDDIEIGAGATVSKLVKLGKHVTFLICTDGRFGKENLKEPISSEKLIKMRHDECLKAAKTLGVNDVLFLNLCDGNQYTYKELLTGIANTINKVKPDIIFAPDPDVDSECHVDHLNVGNACKELVNFANYPEIFDLYLSDGVKSDNIDLKAIALYFTAKPNAYVKTKGHLEKQLESIKCHVSQFPNDSAIAPIKTYIKLRSIEFGFKKWCGKAEGFRMMNRTRMHCMPEASK